MEDYIDHIKNRFKEKKKINLIEAQITDKILKNINENAKKDKDLFKIED